MLLLAVAAAATHGGSVLAKPGDDPVVVGFSVEIGNAGGKEVDTAWESCTGGAERFEPPGSRTLGHEPLVLRGPLTASRKAAAKPEEPLESGPASFRVEVDGALLVDVAAVSVEDLTIGVRDEDTEPSVQDYRTYAPGQPSFGRLMIQSRVGKNSKELYTWWLDTSRGGNIRKSISVICLKRDGTEARRYNFHECFPTSWAAFQYGPEGATEAITLGCTGIELSAQGRRKALCEWINETVAGKPWKRTLTIKEITKDGSAGRTFEYLDCFPVRYVFPRLSASGTGNLYEEVHVKPIRIELK